MRLRLPTNGFYQAITIIVSILLTLVLYGYYRNEYPVESYPGLFPIDFVIAGLALLISVYVEDKDDGRLDFGSLMSMILIVGPGMRIMDYFFVTG